MTKILKIGFGLVTLFLLLSYTWVHTSNLLASYVDPVVVGWLAAAGIELSVVGLSVRISSLRKNQADARFFVWTLIAVVFVSALANMAEGFLVKFGEPLTLLNIGKLDIIQAVISLAATGLISLVTFALAENVGSDLGGQYTQPSIKITRTLETRGLPELPTNQGRLLSYLLDFPAATNSEIQTELGLTSIQAVYGLLGQLTRRGLVRKEGDQRVVVINQE